MFFSDKEHRAYERMMQAKPGFDHYDSGIDGIYPECRNCRSHRPLRQDRFCVYTECPYEPGRSTIRASPARAGPGNRKEMEDK